MSSNRSTSTKPELKLRKRLWREGFRFRINDKHLVGTPDIVLPKYHSVVFVHGCFWHGHKECKLYVVPKTNTKFWLNKVSHNQERDERVWRQLEAKGWAVIIVWECELDRNNFESTVQRIKQEIIANGEAFRAQNEARKLNQQRRAIERKEQKIRHDWLLAEVEELSHHKANNMTMKSDALKLVLKKKWYDLIGSGVKTEEYRAITPYWERRILRENGQARHDTVIFYYGYAKDRPSMTFQIEGIRIGQGKTEWGAELGKEYIVIGLGQRVK